jgi:mRNA interferase MazF
MFKDFINWFKIKPILDNLQQRPLFEEREVWYCSFGENIGREVNGKNNPNYSDKLFLRPVLIFKKLNKETFIGLPLTSKEKTGTWFYRIKIHNSESRIIFSQIRTMDAKRLKFQIYKIGKKEFQDILIRFTLFLSKK